MSSDSDPWLKYQTLWCLTSRRRFIVASSVTSSSSTHSTLQGDWPEAPSSLPLEFYDRASINSHPFL